MKPQLALNRVQKQSELVLQHGNKTFAASSVKWTAGKTSPEWPAGWWVSSKSLPKTNAEHLLMWVRGNALGSPWHCLCQPAPWWPNSAFCRQDPALGAVGRLCIHLLNTSPPQKNKGLVSFAKDSPNQSPHLSSPIYIQLGGAAAGWVNSWVWNPQDFQAKVPWLWQASLPAPLPAFIWCGSKHEQTDSAKELYLCWH